MKGKSLRVASLLLHGMYIVICAVIVIFSKLPLADGSGRFILQLWYISIIALGAFLLIGLVLNIFAMPRKNQGGGRAGWLSWTILSPVLVCVLCLFSTYVLLGQSVQYDKNIDHYKDHVKEYEATLFMPDLDSIDNYTEIEYLCKKNPAFFPSYSLQLIVKYDDETFFKEKARLKTAYTYLDEPQKSPGDENYTIPVVSFSVFGFEFKIAKFDNTVYPKNFGMVGVSEAKREIAYLWLYFEDLDIICGGQEDKNAEMLHFVREHFSLE